MVALGDSPRPGKEKEKLYTALPALTASLSQNQSLAFGEHHPAPAKDHNFNSSKSILSVRPSLPPKFSSPLALLLSLCNPMDCSMLGFPVLHDLLEFPQTHVH